MKNTVNKSHMDTEKVAIVFGDCTLGVKSGNTHYIFSYTRGGLESLNKNGKEWLYRETLQFFGEQRPIMTEVADLDLNPVCG